MSHGRRRAASPDPYVIVLFGATGDLSARKLIPGLFHLQVAGLMPQNFSVIGTSPIAMAEEDFARHITEVVDEFGTSKAQGPEWEAFASRVTYVTSSAQDMQTLKAAVDAAHAALGPTTRTLLYLSIPPFAMAEMVQAIGASGLNDARTRVIMEKPFGTDLASARALNALLHSVFKESQVYRIDHFLGKEDVQDILAVRFANRMFEPMWHGDHVARIEIDVPETLGVEDRAKFYESTGAFRDMVVTHLFQALGFVAMEPPASFDAHDLHHGRTAVFEAMQPIDPARVVRGQYVGYRDLPDVADDSDVETMVAVEVTIDNDRWRGVPIYLRTGKRMAQGRRVITLTFREPPMQLFPADGSAGPGRLVFEIAEPGTFTIHFRAKEPGPTVQLGGTKLISEFAEDFDETRELEAYERLLHDAMIGDATLFNSAEGIERLWEISEPLLKNPPTVQPYEPGTWGPSSVDGLAAPLGWYLPHER
ncbi:MAG: glucose-6-phosphate dehydrogenase [Actinomycetales bacterium]|nr:glucose-6-phosphate dehydrogenase [Actinomycetales bacterium]